MIMKQINNKKEISKLSMAILLELILNNLKNLKIFMDCFKIINRNSCVILNSACLKTNMDLSFVKSRFKKVKEIKRSRVAFEK
jgi:hypothetical protein